MWIPFGMAIVSRVSWVLAKWLVESASKASWSRCLNLTRPATNGSQRKYLIKMQHFQSLDPVKLKHSWVTIGSFDGVHLGHQQILKQLVNGARATQEPSVV